MSVRRNAPCPCGSGKKYKKCCIKKDNLVALQEFKEEKFFQQKEALVEQLKDFFSRTLPPSEYFPLESQFKKRTNHMFDEAEHMGFFHFWLFFFHRFENGLRGIEWFLSEMGQRLKPEDKVMAERWATLKPQFVQAIDQTDHHVIFKDCYSEQTYKMPKSKENIPTILPWISTFGLLEQVNDVYYFNGIRSFTSPKSCDNAIQYVEEIAEERRIEYEQVMFDYYPEILVAQAETLDKNDQEEKEICLYRYEFELVDQTRAENFLYNDHEFDIEEWNSSHKRLAWVSEGKVYTDSELDDEVTLMNIDANLEIESNILTFTTYHLRTVNQFLRKIAKVDGAFRLVNDHEESYTVPVKVDIKQSAVRFGQNTPEYFGLYAQMMDQMNLDQPIPQYDYQSLRQLVNNGKKQVVEKRLRHTEYDINKLVLDQYGEVEITPDFNTKRKELGFPLSPFVTGGEMRHSSIKSVPLKNERKTVVLEEDIPMYENLGFTPDTVDTFYADDIIAFYRTKTVGKSKNTERKYRNSLYDIREILEMRNIKSWNQCDLNFWKRLLTQDIFELYIDVSKAQFKELLTTVKALAKWLAKEDILNLEKEIVDLTKHYEPK